MSLLGPVIVYILYAEYLQITIIDENCSEHKIWFALKHIREILFKLPVHFFVK